MQLLTCALEGMLGLFALASLGPASVLPQLHVKPTDRQLTAAGTLLGSRERPSRLVLALPADSHPSDQQQRRI